MRALLVQFGRRLRKARLAKGWSQEELAFRARLHRNYIGGLERGEQNPTLVTIQRLARSLGMSIAALIPRSI
jgi:transcriptional regulator with XRE-family HTH domain